MLSVVHGYICFMPLFTGTVPDPEIPINSLLTDMRYDYLAGTACTFHDDEGNPSKCSLGYCRQRAKLLIEHFRPLLGSELIARRNIPSSSSANDKSGSKRNAHEKGERLDEGKRRKLGDTAYVSCIKILCQNASVDRGSGHFMTSS